MNELSNNQCLDLLNDHPRFDEFLRTIKWKNFPGLEREKAFLFIKTKVLLDNMPLDSTYQFMRYIREWLIEHEHGGVRKGAGRKKGAVDIRKITLSADSKAIAKAKKYALSKNSSLQQMFRQWLERL